MRTIGVVTVARSDYGIYLPILRRIKRDKGLRLRLFVSGMHLLKRFGMTARVIEKDGFHIAARVPMPLPSDTPKDISKAMGHEMIGFSQLYAKERPDMLLVLGDRFDMFAAAAAALPFKIPIAHVHGGESTEGLIDEAIRHSITKMSHLHFVSCQPYARRVMQLGEEPWRVVVSGAPSLDNLRSLHLLNREQLESRLGLSLAPLTILVTFHPVTLEFEQTESHMNQFLKALKSTGAYIIFTYPNADTSGQLIIRKIRKFTQNYRRSKAFVNLGTPLYFSLMKHVTAMAGNSSSGIVEAASFKLPVVNIGDRQRGRIHGRNVLDVEPNQMAIQKALKRALSPEFRNGLQSLTNLYGDGRAAEKIVRKLKQIPINDALFLKRFYRIGS